MGEKHGIDFSKFGWKGVPENEEVPLKIVNRATEEEIDMGHELQNAFDKRISGARIRDEKLSPEERKIVEAQDRNNAEEAVATRIRKEADSINEARDAAKKAAEKGPDNA